MNWEHIEVYSVHTNLQVLYSPLTHLRLRITLCPDRCQVGGVKLKVFRVCSQVVVKPGSPLLIPQHSLHRPQSAGSSLVIQRCWVTITCQERAHHNYVTPVRSYMQCAYQSKFQGRKAAHAITQCPVKRSESPLIEAQQSVEVGGQDLTGAGFSEAAAVVPVTIYIPAGCEVPTRLCTRFQIHPQLFFTVWGQEKTWNHWWWHSKSAYKISHQAWLLS